MALGDDHACVSESFGGEHAATLDIPEVRRGFVTGCTFGVREIFYSPIDGQAIFEGDIILGTVEELDRAVSDADSLSPLAMNAVVRTGSEFRWPQGTIPFEIDLALPRPERVREAMQHLTERTHLQFPERTDANRDMMPSFIAFVPGRGCGSFVGMRGGRQVITLEDGCAAGNVIHEIAHAAGLWHEQSREDRDAHVRVVWENIQEGMQHNFSQHITDGDDVGPYDYGSIMHYPVWAFSRNRQPTIIAPAGQQIGQRDGLSDLDVAAVRALYPDSSTGRPIAVTAPTKGVQFSGTLPPRATKTFVTQRWPLSWRVVWTVVPRSPSHPAGPQIDWSVQVSVEDDQHLSYFLRITNLTGSPVQVEARYSLL